MAEYKQNKFMSTIIDGLSFISQIISASIFPSVEEEAERIMNNIDERVKLMEKRIIRNISHLLIIGLGAIILLFALLFSLKEYLGWNNTAAFFSIGIIVFVIGLILKIGESNRR